MGLALAKIEEEGRALIRKVARDERAKVFALKARCTPRHAYNLRHGECDPSWPIVMAMAMNYPEIRTWIGQTLGFNPQPDALAKLERIRRMIESSPEEGDQAQPDPDAEHEP